MTKGIVERARACLRLIFIFISPFLESLACRGSKHPIHLPGLRALDAACIRNRHAPRRYRFESIEKRSVKVLRLGDDSGTYCVDANTSRHIHRSPKNEALNGCIDQGSTRATDDSLLADNSTDQSDGAAIR